MPFAFIPIMLQYAPLFITITVQRQHFCLTVAHNAFSC